MTKRGSQLFIQSAIQKAYIKVNEQGTQAAAANGKVSRHKGIKHFNY